MALLELVNLHKAFQHPVVRGVDLHLAPDCTLCLLGPSGCGKTTLLRLVAGLGAPGQLYLHPESRFVARILGLQNLLPGKVQPGGGVKTDLGLFYPRPFKGEPGQPVTLVIRPEGAPCRWGAGHDPLAENYRYGGRAPLYRPHLPPCGGNAEAAAIGFQFTQHPAAPAQRRPD